MPKHTQRLQNYFSRNSLYPVCVRSGMACVGISGIRYIRNSLYPVCVKSGLRQKKIQKGDRFESLKILQKTLYSVYVISGFRYIRFTLNPVSIVLLSEGTPWHVLQLWKIFQGTFYSVYVTAYKAYKICHAVGRKTFSIKPVL